MSSVASKNDSGMATAVPIGSVATATLTAKTTSTDVGMANHKSVSSVSGCAQVPIIPIMFPYSSRTQLRTLVLRNNSDCIFFVKLVTSNEKLIQTQRGAMFCEGNTSEPIKILLNAEPMQNSKALQLDEHIYVYCIGVVNRSLNEVKHWLKNNVQAESELAYKFSVVRSREFAALETVVDLPGYASPLKAIMHPFYRVDDSDCVTAHNIDSDTDTVVPLTNDELLAVLPPDSMIATATDGRRCWLFRTLEQIFPITSGGANGETSMPCGGGS